MPVPLGHGRPGTGYQFPWLIYPGPKGTSLDRAAVGNSDVLAEDVVAARTAQAFLSRAGVEDAERWPDDERDPQARRPDILMLAIQLG